MLLAGIAGHPGMAGAASLISSIFSSKKKKVSVVDAAGLHGFDVRKLKNYMQELERSQVDVLILKMNREDLEKANIKSLHFDIMIYDNKADDVKEDMDYSRQSVVKTLQELVGDKGVLILNADDKEHDMLFGDNTPCMVTYGFNPKASVIPSSIGDLFFSDGLLCCLQKSVTATDGSTVEPQEYKLKMEDNEPDAYNALAAASFAIVNGLDPNILQ
jgi:UDP-N-acetylmuramyl tripeptide synthase